MEGANENPTSLSLRESDVSGEENFRVVTLELREMLAAHFATIGLPKVSLNGSGSGLPKDAIRELHAAHRGESAEREANIVRNHGRYLLSHFADGSEIDVAAIDPQLIPVPADTKESMLFRIATLLWSVPVSRGYGRRLRFLVRDRSNQKLIGILALGSPVFNLKQRDDWIGWSVRDRELRLINVMDAFVVGAVPPYSQLIGGKLVAALVGSSEAAECFDRHYGERKGIISDRTQEARLSLVTTTSALGGSSLYNRLRLPGIIEFHRIGMTSGFGHFHISESIFQKMRELLELSGHRYASGHQYGDGPNWRMRVVRVSLGMLGIEEEVLKHGIQREIYAAPLADNWREYLCGAQDPVSFERPPAKVIADACIQRWLLPRSQRRPEFRDWQRADTWALLTARLTKSESTNEFPVQAAPPAES